ncbi:hypothetical protein COCSADRAFT_172195 [Bipolaris sorokiniana ND90Pr]|uniref:AMP-dependent synthetase/ligase domain-containing protein n=1 Tax=Cochliobolus sativus (strain ND90Pr / ATCC 201652) TaxID=665912 RepID=M2S9E9_COCSN|nr:uncharacterized protein COCSADRAFT_172195 [Bipolaris sorokiniana ND90Pr]EMD63968.1 hypothetical protein COCSADRAFT_172195 [Bipolaris sorokiniana ND90Pr]
MGRIHRSRYTVDIPEVDLLTFVFRAKSASFRRKPQYIDAFRPERHYSLVEGEGFAMRIGLGLRQLGLKTDDKVSLFSSNNLFFPILFWGVIAADCVFTAVSPTATEADNLLQLEYQTRASDAKVLISSPDTVDKALKPAFAVGIPKSQVFVFCHLEDASEVSRSTTAQPWTSFWASEVEATSFQWKASTDPKYLNSEVIILNSSSVEITHANVVANPTQLVHYRKMSADIPEAYARKERLARSGERWLAPLPMYHAYGQIYYCVNAPLVGAKVYIIHRYSIRLLLLFVDIYWITLLTGVPTILVQMSKQPAEMHNPNSIEYALTGSAPLGQDTAKQTEQQYLSRGLVLRQGWGMTETTNSMSGFSPDDPHDASSIGYLNPNFLGKIMPVDGQSWAGNVPTGTEVGELWVSGKNVMKGYYKNPQATSEAIVMEDGIRWLKTGDIAYFNEAGRIFIVDRLKELIKVNGLQVSPAELEAAIVLHPGVADVAVVGVLMNDNECPRAFVVKKDEKITAKTVYELVENRFAKQKWLSGDVIFVDELPKTPSGKVIKRQLTNSAKETSKL